MTINKELLERMQVLGFPLFKPEQYPDANATLADIVKSRDIRLWEGFPVVLFNAAEKNLFNYSEVKKNLAKSIDKVCFDKFYILSLILYKNLDLKALWIDRLYDKLVSDKKNEYNAILGKFNNNKEIAVGNYTLSLQRMKDIFMNYYTKEQSKISDLVSLKEEFDLEYSLSQIFSAKQKELFLKKLKGEKLTKTEKEYFSRTVRKKTIALANPELNRLAQKLL